MQKKRTKTTSRKKAAENKKTAAAKRGSSGSANANEPVQDNTKRNYELRGLAFVAAGLIAICGIAGLNVGFVGLKAAKFLQYFFCLQRIENCPRTENLQNQYFRFGHL